MKSLHAIDLFTLNIFILILSTLLTTLSAKEKTVIRAGHFPNITHAQAVIGHGLSREGKGWFERYLGPDVDIQWYLYSSGPSAMEAFFAESIDLVYVGPSPTINAYVKAKGEQVRIICGSCFGGSALVIQPGSIKQISDFKNKIIATPQLGNTQDIVARTWFRSQGFHFTLFGGDLRILPIENADQLTLFKQKDLSATWSVEPWVSRLVIEAQGEVYLEESTLWPETDGKYVTTHLVCRHDFLKSNRNIVKNWVKGHVELTNWIEKNGNEAKKIFNHEIQKETLFPIASSILERAWNKLEVTYNPLPPSIWKYAKMAFELGFLKEEPDLSGIYDLTLLKEVLQ